MSFFQEIDLSAVEAEAFARGLYAVARIDGVHERELALISDFYQTVAGQGARADVMASLERTGALEPKELAQVLVSAPVRELFLKTALLLSWADGSVSRGERAKVDEFAAAFQIAPDRQSQLEAEVKDFLLRPLAGLANVAAVSAVAKKLGL
jgi:tellurite resistance protein